MSATNIDQEKELALKQETTSLMQTVEQIKITTVAEYTNAERLLQGIKALQKKITDYFEPLRAAAYEAYSKINDRKKSELKPVDDAYSKLAGMLGTWRDEQERIRQEAQRKADAEAAERQRKEQEKLLARAQKAEAAGKTDKAQELAEQAASHFVPANLVPETVTKTTKTEAGSTTWIPDLEITLDHGCELEVAKAIAEGKIPPTVIEVLPGKLKKWAVATGVKNFMGHGIKIRTIQRPSTSSKG